TAPLDPSTFAALGGRDGYAVIDADPLAPYFRTTPDRRLIVGGGRPAVTPAPARARTWDRLTERLHALHPGLDRVDVVRRWPGRIGMTADGLPVAGRVAGQPDVWYAGGCNGHGLAMSVLHAGYLADAICAGDPDPTLPWHRDRAPWLPAGG